MNNQMSKPDTNIGQTVKGSNTLYKAQPDYSPTKSQNGPGGVNEQIGYNAAQGLKKK